MSKILTRYSILILVFSAFSALSVVAQGELFSVRGRILDQNQAVIVGAKVTLTPAEGSKSVTLTTDENGEFITQIPGGNYSLTVTADGFVKRSQIINVSATDVSTVEIALAMGGIDAFVTVSGGGDYGIDTTLSATKTPTALRDIPQSIAIVTRQQISDQAMTSVGDVVRYIPGISVHQGENNRDQVIIRGQNSSADFYLNGVRDDVQYYRDLYNLDRVESLKGPNALVFGRGGGGGVVNRVTKVADFTPITELTFQGGSHNSKRVSGDFGRELTRRLAFRANGVYENSDSFRKFVDLNRLAFSPTITLAADQKTTLTFAYEFLRDRRVADRGITSFQGKPADVPIDTYYGNPDDSPVRSNVNLAYGTIERQLGKLNLKNRTQFGDYDRFYQNYVPGSVNMAKTFVTLTAYNNATHRKNLFNQTDLNYMFSTGGIRHTIVGGMELGKQSTRNFRNTGYFNNTATSIQVGYDSPTAFVPVTFRQSASDADNRLKLDLGAAYVQDQIELSRYFQVIMGVRYDYFDLRYHNNRTGEDIRRIDRLVSPRFGLVAKPVEAISLYASYSESYLPSSGDQFSSLTTITQQVKPEKFANFEVGVKFDLRRNLSFTSALYRLNRTNTRSTDPNDPTRIIQTGSQRTNGFELGLNGSITPRWSITGGYAYQNAFITSATTAAAAGKQVGQVPRNSFSVWNKYQFWSKFSAGLGIIRRSQMFAAVDNTVALPGYTRFDAAIFYTFNEHWRLQANVENAVNRRYVLNADSNTNISPGSPRTVRIGLVARF